MALVVDGVDLGPFVQEVLDDGLVPRDDGQVERGVALAVFLIDEGRRLGQDLLDAVDGRVLRAVVGRRLASPVLVQQHPGLEKQEHSLRLMYVPMYCLLST